MSTALMTRARARAGPWLRFPVTQSACRHTAARIDHLQPPAVTARPGTLRAPGVPGLAESFDVLAGLVREWTARAGREALIDGRTGLIWERRTLLNPPIMDDPRFAERMIRASLGRVRHGATIAVGRAYLLAHVWETNPYHFFCDVLPQLHCCERLGIETVLVSPRLMSDGRFDALVRTNPRFGDLRFVLADGVVRADEVVFGAAGWPSPASIGWVVDTLPRREPAGGDCALFVSRAPGAGRAIANAGEVAAILERHRIQSVDLDAMPVREQQRLFGQAHLVVGVHGAGLANVVARGRAPLAMVELLPSRLPHAFYANLARCLGATYAPLPVSSGEGPPRRAPVWVDGAALDAALERVPSV